MDLPVHHLRFIACGYPSGVHVLSAFIVQLLARFIPMKLVVQDVLSVLLRFFGYAGVLESTDHCQLAEWERGLLHAVLYEQKDNIRFEAAHGVDAVLGGSSDTRVVLRCHFLD